MHTPTLALTPDRAWRDVAARVRARYTFRPFTNAASCIEQIERSARAPLAFPIRQ
jgi:hypothetical protein